MRFVEAEKSQKEGKDKETWYYCPSMIFNSLTQE